MLLNLFVIRCVFNTVASSVAVCQLARYQFIVVFDCAASVWVTDELAGPNHCHPSSSVLFIIFVGIVKIRK